MITSRMLSTWVCVAASIFEDVHVAAVDNLAARVTDATRSAVGPVTQLSMRARIRAVVVLPTPRGPANTKAWAIRPDLKAFAEGLRDVALAYDSSSVWGRSGGQ